MEAPPRSSATTDVAIITENVLRDFRPPFFWQIETEFENTFDCWSGAYSRWIRTMQKMKAESCNTLPLNYFNLISYISTLYSIYCIGLNASNLQKQYNSYLGVIFYMLCIIVYCKCPYLNCSIFWVESWRWPRQKCPRSGQTWSQPVGHCSVSWSLKYIYQLNIYDASNY